MLIKERRVTMNIWNPLIVAPEGTTVIVDNRVFVLGLDKLYREAMKPFEVKRLLPCAEEVATVLGVQAAQVPIEGYYTESPELTSYFRLMRALQNVEENRETMVKHLPEFQLLWDVTNSHLYGRPQRKRKLLPVGRDPLSQALLDMIEVEWKVPSLVNAAYKAALQYDDISLVGLAARTKDPIAIAALRESVVLYAEVLTLGISAEPQYEYHWQVDEHVAQAANHFIDTFNAFVPDALPRAEAANAEWFFKGYADNDIIGRCVRIGQSEDGTQHYHWAIAAKQFSPDAFELDVDEFWSEQLWTTEKYRQEQGHPSKMKFFKIEGVPEDMWKRFARISKGAK
jgi:hypothetical protein